jgi:hypothetical protein
MKTFGRLSFRIAPHSLFVVLISLSPFLLVSPSVVHAQWEPDVRLTYCDSASWTTPNNAWSIAADTSGIVHVVWWDERDGNNEIYYKRSTDSGSSWSQDIRLTYDSSDAWSPSISVSGEMVHVVWADERDGNGEIYYKRSTDSGSSWSSDLRLTNDPSGSHTPTVSAVGPIVHVIWSDDRDTSNSGDIFYKRSTDSGVSWSTDRQLTFDPNHSWYPSSSASGASVHAVWEDNRNGNWEMYYKNSTDAGLTWSADYRLAYISQPIGMPSVSASGPVVFVVWEGEQGYISEIYYRQSTDEGRSWGSETRLTYNVSYSNWPSVFVSGSNVHVVWEDAYEVYYKNSTDLGRRWFETRLTFDPNDSWNASVCAAGSKVHVVWMDSRSGDWEIYYKRNPTGNSGVEDGEPLSLTTCASRLTVFPNPFNSFASIPGHESESFALYDISGRRVGAYRGDRIGEGLSSGVYFLLSPDNKVRSLRIVKVR